METGTVSGASAALLLKGRISSRSYLGRTLCVLTRSVKAPATSHVAEVARRGLDDLGAGLDRARTSHIEVQRKDA